jgi:hypothetical protein
LPVYGAVKGVKMANYQGHTPAAESIAALAWACCEMGSKKTKQIAHRKKLSSFYTRPLYYGTPLQNNTIAELHKDDYKYTKAKWE